MNLLVNRSGRPTDERGAAMVMAVVAVMVVTALAASFFQLSSAGVRRQRGEVDRKQSFYLAEAGLAEAWGGVMVGKTGNVASQEKPALYGNGLFWVEATELADGRVQLESTGMDGTGLTKLGLVVERGTFNVASLGVFADQTLIIPSGVLIDGYDSEKGSYLSQSPESSGRYDAGDDGVLGSLGQGLGLGMIEDVVGHNFDIGLTTIDADDPDHVAALVGSNDDVLVSDTESSPTRIYGDVLAGETDEVLLRGDPVVTGIMGERPEDIDLPPVVVPTVSSLPGVDHSGRATYVMPPGMQELPFLRVRSGSDVRILGPSTYVLNELTVESGAQLVIDASLGAVHLICAGDLDFQTGSLINCTQTETDRATIRVNGDHLVNFDASGQFTGVLYAPGSTMTIGGNMELFGSVVAENLVLDSSTEIHFDAKLAREAEEENLPGQLSWRIVELENVRTPPGVAGNPFDILGVLPADLLRPADAHQSVRLTIKYIAVGGGAKVFEGYERDFNWADVRAVVFIARDKSDFEPMSVL